MTMTCLVGSLPAILNVITIYAVFILIFAILGVQLFKGVLWRCVSPMDPKLSWTNIRCNLFIESFFPFLTHAPP